MPDAGRGRDAGLETKRSVTSSKARRPLGTKGKLGRAKREPQHGPFPDRARGGGGAGVGGPEPHVPRPRSGLWPRRGGAGRGRCGPSRPTALTVNSNPRAALVMVYRSSHW